MSRNTNQAKVENTIAPWALSAGSFSAWLRRIRNALIKENGMEVPCGQCKVCCTSSHFIHIRPEEKQTLKKIPKNLLSAAPGLVKGNVLLGYFENGHCPMFIDGKCSIYAYRPITCRNYDCRIFAAAGIAADDDKQGIISQRVKRWEFSYPSRGDRDQHRAVQTAAQFIRKHARCFPGKAVPAHASQLAILAIKVYTVFLKRTRKSGKNQRELSDMKIAKAVMKAYEKFNAKILNEKTYKLFVK